jgi:bifunctional non-homologous end joining protein LigD
VRFSNHQEFVVGGFKPAGDGFDSLVVGYYEGAKLLSAGKVRSGFTPHLRQEIAGRLLGVQTTRCPFANLPNGGRSHWGDGITEDEMTLLRWVKPRLVVEVAFTEWTRDGGLRHASLLGVRDDKQPKDVRREPPAAGS